MLGLIATLATNIDSLVQNAEGLSLASLDSERGTMPFKVCVAVGGRNGLQDNWQFRVQVGLWAAIHLT